MKVLIFAVVILLCGCATKNTKGTCIMYEDRPFITREYLPWPMRGHYEVVEYRPVCVEYADV